MVRTNDLIIVAGPTAVGKSTYLFNLRNGSLQHLLRKIDVTERGVLYASPKKFRKVDTTFADQLVYHYDFLEKHQPQSKFSHIDDLINESQNTFSVVLCAPTKNLVERISSRIEGFTLEGDAASRAKKLRRLARKKEFYRDHDKLMNLYRDWLTYLTERGVTSHRIVNSTDKYQMSLPCGLEAACSKIAQTLVAQG